MQPRMNVVDVTQPPDYAGEAEALHWRWLVQDSQGWLGELGLEPQVLPQWACSLAGCPI